MTRRVTILFDDDIEKKLRMLHAKEIIKQGDVVTFSSIVNDEIRRGLKNKNI